MIINDNTEEVTCRICGEQCKRIYGKHLKFKHNNMTTNEYKEKFPDAPIMTLSDKNNTTKNSGTHMKQEKYKKMFSEKIKGEKNPNHKSNTTELERRSRSPFSKEFIKYKDIDNIEEYISEFAKESVKDRVHPTTKEYYLSKGYSEEESIELLKERQRTFTLEKCIEKYGKEKGYKRWLDRQENWQKSLLDNGNIKCGYSKISQDLFNGIIKHYKIEDIPFVYYAIKNKEYYISRKSFGFFSYDFTDKNRMKIIEYNGDRYHANPNLFESNDYPHPYYKEDGPTAKEIWKRDNLKISLAKNDGFDVLVIWDSEYRKDKNKTIKKCLNFLQIY
jgi:hypothetical protein